jgi:hypothetical protein
MSSQVAWASEIARKVLEGPLPRRWAHTQGVAAQARSLAPILGDKADLLEASAWVHDIGYSPRLIASGFHPLDGARYLRDVQQADDILCRLVAHHSCAIIEAKERGLADELSSEFAPAPAPLSEALIYCDMTTGPSGALLTVEQRLAEIRARYGPGHLVSRAIAHASPHLVSAVQSVSNKLRLVTAES